MTVPLSGARQAAHERTDAPTTARPPATVVICAYTANRMEILRSSALAVREQLLDGDELLVVIDHNDRLLHAARETIAEDSRGVRMLANDGPAGLSGARNAGAAAARGELVVFLDDDAVPRAGWLAQITAAFADPDVIGTGGIATPAWETARPDWLPDEFLWVVGCSYRGLTQLPEEIRNPIGANMAFRRSVIGDTGGFTDGIGRVGRVPLGCEETEFSIRAARLSGGRILQQPAAVVDHLVTADRMRLRYFLSRCWAEGISKAFVATLTGNDAALASERRYTTRTLPIGVVAGFRDGLTGDRAGFKRSAAIVGGFAVTVAGYLRGSTKARGWRVGRSAA